MESPATPTRAVSAQIHLGRVVEVDPDRWICRVIGDDPPKEFTPVLVSSLFMGALGEGIHAMPEVGARVYVAVPSDGSQKFLVGYAYTMDPTTEDARKAGSFHSGRPYLNPGDIAALSRDQNGVVIRRGGIVEIRSTPLARTIFNPQQNQVLTLAENWEVETFGGKISWRNLHREDDRDGELTAQYEHQVRQYVDSPSSTLRLQMGATEGTRLELDEPVDRPPLKDVSTKVTLLAAGALAPLPITIPVRRPDAPDPAARVVDFRVYDDEMAPVSAESLTFGISRQGAALLETAEKIRIAKDVDTGNSEPVLRGSSFLSALSKSLAEIQAGLNALGVPTPDTAVFLGELAASEITGEPFLSSTLESE
jgi:hypothetical protein